MGAGVCRLRPGGASLAAHVLLNSFASPLLELAKVWGWLPLEMALCGHCQPVFAEGLDEFHLAHFPICKSKIESDQYVLHFAPVCNGRVSAPLWEGV